MINDRSDESSEDLELLQSFRQNGFIIVDDAIPSELSDDLTIEALHLVRAQNCKEVPVPDFDVIDQASRVELLLDCLFRLEQKNHKYIRGIHDALRECPALLRIISSRRICETVNLLLGQKRGTVLFPRPHSVRIDMPNDDAFVLDWHQEVHYAPKDASLIQMWAPAVNDITLGNGALRVLPGSHNGGIAKTNDVVPEFGHAQYTVVPEQVAKYEEMVIEMKRGNVLLFDRRLIHRSGINTSASPRLTAISYYISADSPNFFSNIEPPKKVQNPYVK